LINERKDWLHEEARGGVGIWRKPKMCSPYRIYPIVSFPPTIPPPHTTKGQTIKEKEELTCIGVAVHKTPHRWLSDKQHKQASDCEVKTIRHASNIIIGSRMEKSHSKRHELSFGGLVSIVIVLTAPQK